MFEINTERERDQIMLEIRSGLIETKFHSSDNYIHSSDSLFYLLRRNEKEKKFNTEEIYTYREGRDKTTNVYENFIHFFFRK